jgi:hypothetical protein
LCILLRLLISPIRVCLTSALCFLSRCTTPISHFDHTSPVAKVPPSRIRLPWQLGRFNLASLQTIFFANRLVINTLHPTVFVSRTTRVAAGHPGAIEIPPRQQNAQQAIPKFAAHSCLSQSFPASMPQPNAWHAVAYDTSVPAAGMQPPVDGLESMPAHANTVHGCAGYRQRVAGGDCEKTVRGGKAMQQLSAARTPAIDLGNPLKPAIIRAARRAPTGEPLIVASNISIDAYIPFIDLWASMPSCCSEPPS